MVPGAYGGLPDFFHPCNLAEEARLAFEGRERAGKSAVARCSKTTATSRPADISTSHTHTAAQHSTTHSAAQQLQLMHRECHTTRGEVSDRVLGVGWLYIAHPRHRLGIRTDDCYDPFRHTSRLVTGSIKLGSKIPKSEAIKL